MSFPPGMGGIGGAGIGGLGGAGLPGSAPAGPRLGLPRVHQRTTDSTNSVARALAGGGAPHGTVVTADAQTAGRGRQGRAWSAPAGSSVLMSLVVREPSSLLSLAAGVAVAETAQTFGAMAVAIKWPNDVWVGGAKVAGILVEGRPQERWAVLGIGLNVAIPPEEFPEELRGRATSLGLVPAARNQVLTVLLERLSQWTVMPAPAILDAIRSRDALWRRPLSWADGSGVGAGIDSDGNLLVDTAEGRVALNAGEVHLTVG